MIVSGIWWKQVDACLRVIALSPLLVLLGGCDLSQLLLGRSPAPAPTETLPPPRPDAAQSEVSAGLSPLPTPQQVLTAVPFGRSDPFAPLPSAAAAAAAASRAAVGSAGSAAAGNLGPGAAVAARTGSSAAAGATAATAGPSGSSMPAGAWALGDFRLTGVIRTGGRAEALVSFAGASGSLRLGDQGGRTTGLLPPGWSLASIQFGGRIPDDPPSITLLRAGQRLRVKLL